MHNFRELDIWKRSMKLTESVYTLSNSLPDAERFGLVSQIRRSAVSIPSNIAEGSGRKTDGDFANFLSIAQGSAFELETQLRLIQNLNLSVISDEIFNELNELQKMISSLVNKFTL